MMNCTLCGTENPEGSVHCTLCDAVLDASLEHSDHIHLEPLDASSVRLSWSRVFLVFAILGVIALPWYMMLDLFVVPPEVQSSRDHFERLRHDYGENKDLWDQRKNQVVRSMLSHQRDRDLGKAEVKFRDLPLEVFMAYLSDDCDFLDLRFDGVAIYPEPTDSGVRLRLSKVQRGFWPFRITTSMEIRLQTVGTKLELEFRNLRRGTRKISPASAWQYFSPELQALRRLETFAGGIRSLELHEQDTAEGQDGANVRVSWRYHHRPFVSMTP